VKPGFFFFEALRSIRSNVAIAVAAIVTVMIAVFILGTFIPSFLYVQSTVDKQKDRLDVKAYISDSATDQQVSSLQNHIKQLQQQGLVKDFQYVSKDEAVKDLKERLRDPSILELLPSNVIPASFRIQPVDPNRNAEIRNAIVEEPAIDHTMGRGGERGVTYAKQTTDRLLKIATFIQYAGLALVSILTVASVLLIANTIRLSIFARRREVEVMRLVGATNWFIRWPFVIEGLICGVVGALIAIGLLWAGKVFIVDAFVERNDSLTKAEGFPISFLALAALLTISGAVVGALGSGITLRRFLKI